MSLQTVVTVHTIFGIRFLDHERDADLLQIGPVGRDTYRVPQPFQAGVETEVEHPLDYFLEMCDRQGNSLPAQRYARWLRTWLA
jgi:hypothetical protein